MARQLQAQPYGLLRQVAYWICWVICRAGAALLFRLRIQRRPEPLPAGPFVIAANHCSFLDPILLSLTLRRRIVYLVTSDVYTATLRPFFWFFNCIRVEEDRTNRSAIRQAVAELRVGNVVGIFPEGGISRDGRLKEGATGVASLLLQADAPVVPVGIEGTHEALPRHRRWPRFVPIRVSYGPIIQPHDATLGRSRSDARRALRDLIMASINGLLSPGQQAQRESLNREAMSVE